CESARCPNIAECFGQGVATFMILGDVCTRNCRFCAVNSGTPPALDSDEPHRVAQAVQKLDLSYVVITSVTRDDLPDGGAGHFAETIQQIRIAMPHTPIEVLVPDFQGSRGALQTVVGAQPEVLGHNVETVPSLYRTVRPEARYARSLKLLELVKNLDSRIYTKSGLMLGLGESKEEILSVLEDLREAGCDILTLGQYLRPSKTHVEVKRFVPPEEFQEYKTAAVQLGFPAVAAGPFVRSSYRAGEFWEKARDG
ncbi:MAG: lipoyl synthase, partial [Candidatus Latescibacteria bacterium]|nr:lipoyl synthase [Candidatus Latescibacterota bacterium]